MADMHVIYFPFSMNLTLLAFTCQNIRRNISRVSGYDDDAHSRGNGTLAVRLRLWLEHVSRQLDWRPHAAVGQVVGSVFVDS